MFDRQPKQKPYQQINEGARAAAAAVTSTTSATIRAAAADAREHFGREKRARQDCGHAQQQARLQSAIGNRQSAMIHFNSIRGPSASSLGFSPVAGKCSASTAPKFRKAQIRSSGSHFWATSFSSKTEWFHFNGGTALRMPRSAITSILRSSSER